jgi:hypothetical protein
MENATTLHFRGIGCYFVIIVSENLRVYVSSEKLLAHFRFDKEKVQEINKVFLELVKHISI